MAREKYQIFVSSTYEDLKEERLAVERAILKMGHIPVGMEMFASSNDDQWRIIAHHIEESDYYVVIVAKRYGSTAPDGIGYTEKEYDWAVSRGVPVLGFVINEDVKLASTHMESTDKGRKKLTAFVNKVKQKPVSFWRNAGELSREVVIALNAAFYGNPRPGWARRDPSQDQVAPELARLSNENAELRTRLAAAVSQDGREQVASLGEVTFRVRLRIDPDRLEERTASLLAMFRAACPLLMRSARADSLAVVFAQGAGAPRMDSLDAPPYVEDALQVLVALEALGLVDYLPADPMMAEPEWRLSSTGRSAWGVIFRQGVKDAASARAALPDQER